jgi:hypothetical protein
MIFTPRLGIHSFRIDRVARISLLIFQGEKFIHPSLNQMRLIRNMCKSGCGTHENKKEHISAPAEMSKDLTNKL